MNQISNVINEKMETVNLVNTKTTPQKNSGIVILIRMDYAKSRNKKGH